MKTIIVHLLKEWGIKAVLNEMISVLKNTKDQTLIELATDLQTALDKFEKREKKVGE